ncbi:CATION TRANSPORTING ATPASE [Salix viminalis]|uniref:CATION TRANSPORTING ATPASE n=1 Tax=Salix viminalis TaxID=40686 RepID=A0A9Q0Z4Y8_SALVM|nr:CATION TRANSPORTING ATPASE [Salix viminalis]
MVASMAVLRTLLADSMHSVPAHTRNRQQRDFSIVVEAFKDLTIAILVGDVVRLEVPADELFIDGHSLQIDESSMTGERDDVEINHKKNPFLVSSTKVADGYGQMPVTKLA